MKIFLPLFALFFCSFATAQKVPTVFADYLEPDVAVKGEVVVVVPPDEIQQYIRKVDEVRKADPEWFAEYSEKAKPGVPLPFHEKLGLSEEEYADYLELWDQRKMEAVPQGEVIVRLEQAEEGLWRIRVTGVGSDITTMLYNPADDTYTTTSGVMKRIEDIAADKRSILGAWTGKEWKMELEDSFGTTKENLAIGKLADGSFGLLVYRIQEVSTSGRRLFDKSMVIRFAIKQS
ncbi:hypothetical protein [Roseibacillus ishigakijimensis]|uniref:Uncharacterized protein n=1 Tax=Roseibacillus ishigakijimensis TaxID=454146 RepID=A0A934RU23_9BACT|nr:hypothetical protein [Roseibacillus ishigakijimensis]MBK1834501.1 hypothetical protein [Roseibacillus ishigakijimensis]